MIPKNLNKSLEPILRAAGKILLSYYGKQMQITLKPGNGFVTQADIASEQYLMQALLALIPGASVHAEESGASGQESDYCWVIDPLDGTTNFARGLPYWCVSVALTYKDLPVAGAIYVPLTDEYFFAQQGMGATCNGTPIHVSELADLGEALISIRIPYFNDLQTPDGHLAEQVVSESYGIRHLGAIALDLANIACGRLDGVILRGVAWWDVAAGIVLIQEAGGQITGFEGKKLEKSNITGIAGGKLVYTKLTKLVS